MDTIAKVNLYFADLPEEAQSDIDRQLKKGLKDEIDDAVESGLNQETAEREIIESYINEHNFANEYHI